MEGNTVRIVATYENLLPRNQADAEVFVNTAAALARQPGVEVELRVPHNPDATAEDIRAYFGARGNLKVTPIRSWRGFLPTQHLFHAVAATRGCRTADVVYTRNIATLAAALQRGRRAVLDHYRPWPDQVPPLQPLLRRLMGQPGFLGVIAHSEVARRSYLAMGVPEEKLMVAHNGWDPVRMEPVLSRTEARRRVGLPHGQLTVVYTGRINRQKGLETVLDIARRCPDVLFVLVGSQGEGPIERAARALPNVRIEPWRRFADTAPFLYGADVLIVPPSASPLLQHGNTVLPLKLFLYLAAGRAILGPDTPDVAEILDHDRNALLVRPGDVDAAARALQRLRDDPRLRERLGRAARRQAWRCTWDARADRIRRFLQTRLAASRNGAGARLGDWQVERWLSDTGRWLAWVASRGSVIAPARNVLDPPRRGALRPS
ncbi:MAG: glycosyltransferase family 4 protein [Myxococcota bacterium]